MGTGWRQKTGIKGEAFSRLSGNKKRVMGGDEGAQTAGPHLTAPTKAGQRDMGRKAPPVRGQAAADKGLFDTLVKSQERGFRGHAGPQDARFGEGAEQAHGRDIVRKRGGPDRPEDAFDIVDGRFFHFADKAQGKVKLIVPLPADAGQAPANGKKPFAGFRGQLKGDKKTNHKGTPGLATVAVAVIFRHPLVADPRRFIDTANDSGRKD